MMRHEADVDVDGDDEYKDEYHKKNENEDETEYKLMQLISSDSVLSSFMSCASRIYIYLCSWFWSSRIIYVYFVF